MEDEECCPEGGVDAGKTRKTLTARWTGLVDRGRMGIILVFDDTPNTAIDVVLECMIDSPMIRDAFAE